MVGDQSARLGCLGHDFVALWLLLKSETGRYGAFVAKEGQGPSDSYDLLRTDCKRARREARKPVRRFLQNTK